MRFLTSVLITLLLVISFFSNLLAFEPQFTTRLDYQSQSRYGTTILVADFDGDGYEDVFDGVNMNGIYINFNTQEGNLSSKIFRGFTDEIDLAEMADIDGDGDIDLIIGYVGAYNDPINIFSVQLNDGTGYFEEIYSIDLGERLEGLHAVDMDGDGDQDLIVRYYSTLGAELWLNDGLGNLTASGITYPFPDHIWEIGFGDIDNDGDIDIVPGRIMSDTLLVYFNNGDGSLAPPVEYYCPEGGPGVSVVDMNADGYLDIVATEDYVCVLLNQTDGTFGPYLQYDLNGTGFSVMTEDFDGDSYPDVVVEGYSNDGMLIMRNRGDGSLEPAEFYSAGNDPVGLASIDLNNDGRLEILSGNRYGLSVFTNLGDGKFVDFQGIKVGKDISSVLAIDLNGDGDLDLVGAMDDADKMVVLMSQGDGNFDLPIEYQTGIQPFAICEADLDLDGDIDLISVNFGSDDISVFMNNGDGTFEAAISYDASTGPSDVVVADVDNNGYPDICVTSIFDDAMSVLINDGSGQFGLYTSYAMGKASYSIHAVDLNNDGYVDLVTADPGYWIEKYSNWNPASVWVNYNLGFDNLGTGVFFGDGVQFSAITEGGEGYSYISQTDITSNDIDDDGDLDLILSFTSDGMQGITILKQHDGDFIYDQTLESTSPITQFVMEDLDGDGDADIAAANHWRNNVTVFTNSGDGNFGLGVNYGACAYSWKLCAGDIDGDAQVDLVVASNYWTLGDSSSISILYNTGSGGLFLSCCGQFTSGLTGNVNCDSRGLRDLADITLLIDHIYISKSDLCCDENGNTNGDPAGIRDLSDITALIDFVYISKLATATCL